MAGSGHVKKMARDGDAAGHAAHACSINAVPLRRRRRHPAAPSTATRTPCWRSSSASARSRGAAVSAARRAQLTAARARASRSRRRRAPRARRVRRRRSAARRARTPRSRRRTAEVAFEVADEQHGRGIGTALAQTLAADARAAGIAELHATVAVRQRAARCPCSPALAPPARHVARRRAPRRRRSRIDATLSAQIWETRARYPGCRDWEDTSMSSQPEGALRRAVFLAVTLVGLVFVPLAGSAHQGKGGHAEILVLSNRADLVSGGDALVQINLPDKIDPVVGARQPQRQRRDVGVRGPCERRVPGRRHGPRRRRQRARRDDGEGACASPHDHEPPQRRTGLRRTTGSAVDLHDRHAGFPRADRRASATRRRRTRSST